jgi:peroxiredoxin
MKLAVGMAVLAALLVPADLAIGGEVPDIAFKAVDGKECKLADLCKAGKVVVIVSWSKECPSNALTRVDEVAKKYEANDKVAFIGVCAFGDTADGISNYLKDKAAKYAVVHDADKSISKTIGATNVNKTYVIKDGKLFWRGGCAKNGKDTVVDAIEAALAGKAAPEEMKKFAG